MHVRRIPEHVIESKRLGRHVEHDPRSRDFPADTPAPVQLVTVQHRRHGAILNQAKIGSCTGNATAGAINTEPLYTRQKRLLINEDGAVELYQLATTLDNIDGSYPPDDTGSTGLAVAKAAKAKGYIRSYRHAFGIDHALAALQVRPVITGVDWYEGFDHPDENGLVKIDGQVRGGHEFEVVGYDVSNELVHAINSWGKDWGKLGHFFFTKDTWAQLLSSDGDVTILIP